MIAHAVSSPESRLQTLSFKPNRILGENNVNQSLCGRLLGATLVMFFAWHARATPSTAPLPPLQLPAPVPLVQAIPANLVANGDFETGVYGPQWTLAPGGPFDLVCKAGTSVGAATCIAHGGQYAMSFGLAGAQDSLSQNISTVPGTSYTLSFFVANDNPGDVNTTTFAVHWNGATVYSLPSPQPSFPYRQVVLNLIATSNSTPLVFVAQNDPSQWFLDDVTVLANPPTPVPTLNGWGAWLAVLLFSGVAAWQIRRLRS